jgi:undecaprenyl-diphosphatase
MSDSLIAIILGIVEGVTEYLPISSTGHLIIFNELLGFTGERAKNFDIIIQLGAILSVLTLFRERFAGLLSGMARFKREPLSCLEPGMLGAAGCLKLGVVSAPALVIGFLFSKQIKGVLFAPLPVAAALALGALAILFVEGFLKGAEGKRELEQLTWRDALLIGAVQCFALWPGMSRSAATIIGGVVAGLSRRGAAEFSFLAAVPVLTLAALHDLAAAVRVFSYADLGLVAIGFVASYISSLLTMRWFIGIVSRWSLRPFAWYRLVLAGVVVWVLG